MGNKLWQTPRPYFAEQWRKYRFNVDAAANEYNALVRPSDSVWGMDGEDCDACGPAEDGIAAHFIGRFYTEETDGRLPEHYQPNDQVFCNPPYDAGIKEWLKTARETSRDIENVLWYLLLPPATETAWFHKYVWDTRFSRPREGVEMILPPGRIKFGDPTEGKRLHPRAGNLVVIFHPREQT